MELESKRILVNRWALPVLMSSILSNPGIGWGANGEVPMEIHGAKTISAEQLVDEVVAQYPDLVMIDARMQGDRDQGYIEGSVSLPDSATDCDRLTEIIPSHDTPTMFYCNGVKCERSSNAISKAVGCGYKQIYWLRGGFNEWKSKGFPYLNE